jgi:hypothetical protein
MTRRKPVGWRQEPGRHSLAARGIKTGRKTKPRAMTRAYRGPTERRVEPKKQRETRQERHKRETLEMVQQPSITEREVQLVKRRLNTGKVTFSEVNDLLEENPPIIADKSQHDKGVAWLTKNRRKLNPFQQGVLKDIYELRLVGYERQRNVSSMMGWQHGSMSNFALPVYRARTSDDRYFDYTVSAGEFVLMG